MPATPRSLEELGLILPRDMNAVQRLMSQANAYEDEFTPEEDLMLAYGDLEKMRPPVWYMHKLIPENGLAVLYGPPKVGKTFLALDWAFKLARREPWLDHGVYDMPLRVLYLAGEGIGSLGQRSEALRQKRGWRDDNGLLKFQIGSRDLYNPSGKGLSSGRTADFLRAVNKFRPHVVFVDTLMRHTQGADVASNHDMGVLIGFLDDIRQAWGPTIVLIHHTTKAANDFMGAQHIYGTADVMMHLKPTEGEIELSTLSVSSRDWDHYVVPYHLQVQAVDPEKAGWATLEATEKPVQSSTHGPRGQKQHQVLAFLASGEKKTSEVQEEVWGDTGSHDAARKVLDKLYKRGLVERFGSPTKWKLPQAERAGEL